MIAVLIAFIAYQGYKIVLAPTAGLAILTVFDILIVFLTWHEYRRQRQHRRNGRHPVPSARGDGHGA
ncbi:hypothetical protein ACQCSX_19105 [Pseudarthrobacter sp. P1]|uniref:hypothetical protein n=1 Tax=Pseudarthrobacter sp. P1 TaxID=3418418 RepID=UPI003CED2716